jgi:two-component system, response regulator
MTPDERKLPTVLVADDDPDDRDLTREAFAATRAVGDLRFVEDGQELLDYLYRRGAYAAEGAAPRPDLLLLDLNMPRIDGREALRVIKSDPALRTMRVVILTTSRASEDVQAAYDISASSYIPKPASYRHLLSVIESLARYWLEIVELPPATDPLRAN